MQNKAIDKHNLTENQRQTKEKFETDKQLSISLNCKHEVTETQEVYRADKEDEAPYRQFVDICLKCGKEII